MIQKINESVMRGGGPIRVLYPGLVTGKKDTGIGSIGRIDHAYFKGDHIVRMHPHVNDEILSYFRTGKTEHKDSEGYVEIIGKSRLMLMKAGKIFYHEEHIMDEGEPMEGLQIFIRPGNKDLQPQVIFLDLDELHSINKWRLLASPLSDSTFQFSSKTWIYDLKLINATISLPKLENDQLTYLLYVFNGCISVNKEIVLTKKQALVIIEEDTLIIDCEQEAELVLFVTDENAEYYAEGMYSGNQIG